jgi:nucleotide-binding universal stress UspA family protein
LERRRRMYERILIALDGSKESECIVDHVRTLAEGSHIPKVVLLRVVEPFPPAATNYMGDEAARDIEEKARQAAEEYLSYIAGALRTYCGGVETVVVEGNPAHEILEYATHNNIDMIAMSTHGESGMTRWTTGSVTRRIMDHWAGPLLTAPPIGCRP